MEIILLISKAKRGFPPTVPFVKQSQLLEIINVIL